MKSIHYSNVSKLFDLPTFQNKICFRDSISCDDEYHPSAYSRNFNTKYNLV